MYIRYRIVYNHFEAKYEGVLDMENKKVISAVTRKQLIEDGDLIDITEKAREAAFTYHTAISRAAWAEMVETSEEDAADGQSEEGRLWDVLIMLRMAITTKVNAVSYTPHQMVYYFILHKGGKPREVQLKALFHPGDNLEPCMTILLPNED